MPHKNTLNMSLLTFWATTIQGCLGVLATALVDKHPEVSFWSGVGVTLCAVITLSAKQWSQKQYMPRE
jgi:hypothetical protein